jgi:spermidine/putrescine transport system substrate-binding protein
LYDGQDPNDIRKINKVYKALAKRHPLVARYWESGAELEKLLAGGEIWVTPAWSGRVANLRAKGLPIGFLTPPRTYAWNECIFAIRGANCGAASVLINRLIQPETAIAVAQAMKYPPSLDPTKVQMPEAIQKLPGFDPTGRLEGLTFADPAHWQRNEAAWSAAFAKIKAGQPVG